jgi:phytol kinase
MNQQTMYAIIFLGIFLLLVGISHLLYRWLNVSSENSRKFLHVSGGFLALCSPLFFTSHWWILILCTLAFLLLFITYIRHWLPAVHQTNRKSIGSVVYPIPVYICFLAATYKSNNLLFYLPVSLLTVSDTMAELGGKRWGAHSKKLMKKQKTIAGSISFAVSALILSIVWAGVVDIPLQQVALLSLSITLIATTAEMISTRGWDNITVPLSTLLGLLLLLRD